MGTTIQIHYETLEEFGDGTVFREGQRAVLIEPTDTNRFISFVRGVFVCTDKTLQTVPSCNQISTVPELLAFVLNNIKRKKKRNVLAHGYGYPSAFQDRDADQFKFHGEVTQSAAYVHGSDLWKRICQRLGTDVTKYLLESCSVFVTVPPSSAFQVCGVPVYDRVSTSTGISRFDLGYKLNATTGNARSSKEGGNRGWEFQGSDMRKRRRRDGGGATGKRKKGEEVSLGGKRKRDEEKEEGEGCLPGKRKCTQREASTVSSGTSDCKLRTLETNGVKRPVEVISLTKGPTQSLQVSVEMEQLRKPLEQMAGGERPVEAVMLIIEPTESSMQVPAGHGEQISMKTGCRRPAETPAVVQRPVEEKSGAKIPVEAPVSATVHIEGGPSWRSGLFPPLPPSQCFIRTLGMLYGGRGMRSFLLNRKRKGGDEGPRRLQGRDLVRLVFFEGVAYLNGTERKTKRLPRRFFNMVPWFSQLLCQHRSCPYSKILQRVCPRVGDGEGDSAALLSQHTALHRVYLFVRECLSMVVPLELWGSDHNRLNFLSRVRNFLSMGKFERISLAELMWKMKVNDCDWLKISKTGRCPPSELSYRTRLLGQLLAWLLDGYVLGLVRAMFYVTESMGQKNALRFYRYQVWAKLQELAFRGHLSKGQMSELTLAQVMSLPKTTVTSRLRFIPKTDGMRPITRVIGADAKTRLFQARVRDLLDVLRVCVRSSPSLLGSTVWGMTDIHRVLSSITPAQKDKPRPLYFVKVDVSGAYDSLPHTQLLEVIGQVLSHVQEELFSVRRYAKVWADNHEGLKKTFVRQADFMEDTLASTNMKGFVMSLQREGKVHDAILVEQHFSTDVHGKVVLEFFTQMLSSSVVQFGKKTFRQCQGIPQGSVVSSLLCCLCYGHMENLLFPDVAQRGGCLMRLVDDFLLITPDLNQAQNFLKTLMAGVPQYGCVVNPQKVAVNFPVGEGGSCPAGVRLLPFHCLFPWCGLLLDTHTLDVYNDYTSYAGLSLRYSLTLGSAHCAGQQMKRKLMSILRLKCHALFLDLKTNSLKAVYKNIYKLVLLHAFSTHTQQMNIHGAFCGCGVRFHACAQSLPFGQKVGRNPAYFLNLIWDMAEYTNQLVRLCNKGLSLGCTALTGILQYEAVELIYSLTFLLVLSRHRPLYKDLLPPLHTRKRKLERKLGGLRLARIRQAATPKIPEDFKAIWA
ncbi:telomerase reverse transcriptase isoform X2 [Coregonus clupeaformis]|uniref:telomerase reverse transcriptase isoform X2 n=1 Tax=Coregonus clupeaformis TaxID=59861 RepID=UPI001BDFCC93|nr:telomerase reverse transcriptase isoform X2 [Coregonus clupeaformis]